MTPLAPAILDLLAERDAPLVHIAVLQPADPFLDMAGEDLRRRIFLTESETGEALCLRPEFTIPVCLNHIASQSGTPRRYGYLGEVFRQRREGRNEFLQAGIEDLGETDGAAADARSLADAHALLRLALPGVELRVTLGDQGVFEAVLAGLGLPQGWRTRLARAFGAPDLLASALAELENPTPRGALAGPLADLVAKTDMETLSALIGEEMAAAGLSPTTGRTPDEIAGRLIEKAELARLRLPATALNALKIFLRIDVPLERAEEALAAFGRGARLSLGEALEVFTARAHAIRDRGLPKGAVRYDAAFGRPPDYYTGMVFEIVGPIGSSPLAGGGRYDRMLTLLGAETPIPGVGFSVWLDRVETLREGPR